MKNTNIQWTDHTLNFWWGCTKVSPACAHCYAESVANVFGKRLFGYVPRWGVGMARAERLQKARAEALAIQRGAVKAGTRHRVFVNSMSDWLDDEVPVEWLAYLLETLAMCPNVDFQLLTKRPEKWGVRVTEALAHAEGITGDWPSREPSTIMGFWLNDWLGGLPPSNLWIGTTVENQEYADKRIPALLDIPAKVRFLSCEPLLGAVDIERSYSAALGGARTSDWEFHFGHGIHWVIAGGESGGKARPSHPGWFRKLRDDCAAARVPFFFKQWGEWIGLQQMTPEMDRRSYPGHHFDDTPAGLMLRVGSKHTGRLLDGVEHSAFPNP